MVGIQTVLQKILEKQSEEIFHSFLYGSNISDNAKQTEISPEIKIHITHAMYSSCFSGITTGKVFH